MFINDMFTEYIFPDTPIAADMAHEWGDILMGKHVFFQGGAGSEGFFTKGTFVGLYTCKREMKQMFKCMYQTL